MADVYGETHTVSGTIDPLSETQIALCGVWFHSSNVEQRAPTCRWCQRKIEQLRGTWRHASAAQMNKLIADEAADVTQAQLDYLHDAVDKRKTT